MYTGSNMNFGGAECVEYWKAPSLLNGFFIWTSIKIRVHMESKVKSWILGYWLVADLHISKLDQTISLCSAAVYTVN